MQKKSNYIMRQFIVLVGNNGTGKTFFSKNTLSEDFTIVRPDDFKGGIESIQKQMFEMIESGLANNETIVLDGLNLEKSQRMRLLYFVNKYPDCPKIIYDFGPGNHKTLERLAHERPTTTYEEWAKIFSKHHDEYQKPSEDEGYDKIIEIHV